MRALLSVANREGISAFARELQRLGVELFATDGTREHLAADGIEVASVSELTDVPPLVGGQVRTFHPAIYAGILARRDSPSSSTSSPTTASALHRPRRRQRQAVRARGRARPHRHRRGDRDDRRRRRGAARRRAHATPPGSPRSCDPATTARPRRDAHPRPGVGRHALPARRRRLRHRRRLLRGDRGLPQPDRRQHLSQALAMVLEKVADLPYGENPHQRAAFYRETTHRSGTLADATQLHGSPPTFNNLLDLDAAYRIARGLHGADGRHHQAHRPGRRGVGGGAGRGLPAGARHGPRRVVRRHRGRQPGARRRDRARDRRPTRTRR